MKALVTGGGGFVGGAVARMLRARGDEVRSFARGDYPALRALGVDVVRGDLGDRDAVMRATAGVDVVFHVGAKAGVWGSLESYRRANVDGTAHVIAACRAHGVGRLVFTSSPSVVFDDGDLEGVDERAPYPTRFLAHYPATKAEAEQAVLAANGPGLATVALRPHLVWGPGDQHLVPRIVARAKAGKLRGIGDGHWKVDTTYIDNAADAHLAAAEELGAEGRCAGKAYFVSNGEPIAVGSMIDQILRAAGLPPVGRRVPERVAYAAGWVSELIYGALGREDEPMLTRFMVRQLSTAHWFDIRGARRDFGWAPKVRTEEGMLRLGAWIRGGGLAKG